MSILQPTIVSLNPVEPIAIVFNHETQKGISANLQITYTVTDNAWLQGRPDIHFIALLRATAAPYHVVGGTPNAARRALLNQQSDQFTFDFSLETTSQIIGQAFPVSFMLCVYDMADPVMVQRCDIRSYSVTLQ